MTSGGARYRSGPRPDPWSLTSDKRGYRLETLPSELFTGDVPDFPLPARKVYRWEYEDKRRFQVLDPEATEAAMDRERDLWAWLWCQPQASMWSLPGFRWLLATIGLYVRTFVICESSEATAADKNSLHRFADQIGMTTTGLAAMGFRIEHEPKPKPETAQRPQQPTARDRIKLADDEHARFEALGGFEGTTQRPRRSSGLDHLKILDGGEA